jgi:hypothetical protein
MWLGMGEFDGAERPRIIMTHKAQLIKMNLNHICEPIFCDYVFNLTLD